MLEVLLFIGLYLLMGPVMIFIAALIHIIKAERKGFDALSCWSELEIDSLIDEGYITKINFIVNMIFWPYRLLTLILIDMKYFYEQYPIKY